MGEIENKKYEPVCTCKANAAGRMGCAVHAAGLTARLLDGRLFRHRPAVGPLDNEILEIAVRPSCGNLMPFDIEVPTQDAAEFADSCQEEAERWLETRCQCRECSLVEAELRSQDGWTDGVAIHKQIRAILDGFAEIAKCAKRNAS